MLSLGGGAAVLLNGSRLENMNPCSPAAVSRWRKLHATGRTDEVLEPGENAAATSGGMSYDHSSNAIAPTSKKMSHLRRIIEHPHRHTTQGLSGHRTSATAGQNSIQRITRACDEM